MAGTASSQPPRHHSGSVEHAQPWDIALVCRRAGPCVRSGQITARIILSSARPHTPSTCAQLGALDGASSSGRVPASASASLAGAAFSAFRRFSFRARTMRAVFSRSSSAMVDQFCILLSDPSEFTVVAVYQGGRILTSQWWRRQKSQRVVLYQSILTDHRAQLVEFHHRFVRCRRHQYEVIRGLRC